MAATGAGADSRPIAILVLTARPLAQKHHTAGKDRVNSMDMLHDWDYKNELSELRNAVRGGRREVLLIQRRATADLASELASINNQEVDVRVVHFSGHGNVVQHSGQRE